MSKVVITPVSPAFARAISLGPKNAEDQKNQAPAATTMGASLAVSALMRTPAPLVQQKKDDAEESGRAP